MWGEVMGRGWDGVRWKGARSSGMEDLEDREHSEQALNIEARGRGGRALERD